MAATAPVRRKKRHFRSETVVPGFDIEFEKKPDTTEDGETTTYRERRSDEEPDVLTLKNINKMEGHSAFEFLRISQTDPERALRMLVGDDQWDRFWVVEGWMNEEFETINNLQKEAMEHYTGMSVGNS